MSSSFRVTGSVVSIPINVRKTIQNIREISGNHSDDEIYAMLKECSMDPNETAQKLLLQDTFHEVKRKRDRRKETPNNREPGDSRWRTGMQGRGGRGGRGSYSPRYVSYDAGGGRNSNTGKENGVNQDTEKGASSTSSSSFSHEVEDKAYNPTSSFVTPLANGPVTEAQESSTNGCASQEVGSSGGSLSAGISAIGDNKIGSTPPPLLNAVHPQPGPRSDQFFSSVMPTLVSGVYYSASDPVLMPSLDSRAPGVVGTIKREVGSQRTTVEPSESKPVKSDFPNRLQISQLASHELTDSELSSSMSEKVASEIESSFLHGSVAGKSQGVERNQVAEVSYSGSSVNRSSSNYNTRSQLVGPQKVGPSMEWKPKSTNPNPVQVSGNIGMPTVAPATGEANVRSASASSTTASEETVMKLQKKLDEFHFSDGQHVIIPNHLQVPEAERTGLSFGSFGSIDISFGLNKSVVDDPESDKSSTPLSESSQEIEETAEEPSSCIENASPTDQEGDYPDHPQSPMRMPERLSSGDGVGLTNITAVPEYDQSKPEVALAPGGPQYSVVQTCPNYSTFGVMPPMLGSQFGQFEGSEPQAREVSRLPSFVVQQPFDPSTSYYTPFYRPSADGDARFSPFLAPSAATKYNGNVTVLSSQTGQSPQESGNSLVPSTTPPSPLATQAAGVMPSSIAVTQQPVPVFRQPAGVHISHIPPGYVPYSQYFSPFYVPPPTIHHFLTNTAFPQQPPAGSIYPPPAAAAAAAVKYSLSQYKPGTNSGNSTHIGMPPGYSPYSSAPTGYSPSPVATAGNSTGNEDLTGSQYKENNVYIAGQQSEGSAVWIPATGRDISGLQASSFYNLPPQGQHMTFAAPTQTGHGAFAGLYHPAQTVAAATVHPLLQQSQTMGGAVEMAGPQAGVYQQPQRAQINWANNY